MEADTTTNPFHPHHRHHFLMCTDWPQVQSFLLDRRREEGEEEEDPAPPPPRKRPRGAAVPRVLQKKLAAVMSLPVYTNPSCVENTLRFMFYHMRCGLYVQIRQHRVQMFVPFVNKHYRNDWPALEFESGSRHRYYHQKDLTYHVKERIIQHEEEWWSNGHLICNVRSPQVWGDHFLRDLHDMLVETCKTHKVEDVEFFINKRDFPHIRADHTYEPYPFFSKSKQKHDCFQHLCPIMSFYTSPEYADIGLPLPQDWNPPAIAHKPSWEDRICTAFFRGSATGAGTTPADNTRLRLAQLSHTNNKKHKGVPYLDAGITSWNMRDKKMQGHEVRHIKPEKLGFDLQPYIQLEDQVNYRYIIYVDGHCAASRYSQLMHTGSLILKVESSNHGRDLWFFPLLRPFKDHVPVKEDLSDLYDKIQWCLEHDDECRAIARAGCELARKHLSRAAISTYLSHTLNTVAKKQRNTTEVVEPHVPLYSAHPPPSIQYIKTLQRVRQSSRSSPPRG